ncbi:MAG: methyltransferase [Gammaproteobacteria bacterium]|jgi:predicted nicotinamide N-methyase|nr:methyltransferase [Gammaproteobacteria bacterium]MBQ0773909.1 methyltransferase [Gammaproteobacteria bacterium]
MVQTVSAKKTDKHVVFTRGLKVLSPAHKEVKRLKKDAHLPSIHGDKVWNSSFLVMDYLARNKPPKTSTMMDLGCGWGLLGIYASNKLVKRVVAVDADADVFPYLALHQEINGAKNIDTLVRRFEKLKKSDFDGVHTIAGADICFWDALAPVLHKMIKKAIKAGAKRVIIADPGRDPFYELVAMCEKDKALACKVVEKTTTKPKAACADLMIVTPA